MPQPHNEVEYSVQNRVSTAASTKIDRTLRGYRGAIPAGRDAVVDQVTALSAAAQGMRDRLQAIDLNPVQFLESGGVALDALIIEQRPSNPSGDER